MTSKSLKFIADAMLGRLAKWLRILGYDVVYEPSISDNALIARALRDDRIILSMDKKLIERISAKNSLYIKDSNYKEQLKQVLTHYNIDYKTNIFTRCLVCNRSLDTIHKEKIQDKVFPYVYSIQDKFYICQQCNRIYWAGTHRINIVEKLNEILKDINLECI
ncbi:MAG: Mut7-C RNAse domain-containing protein [Candidatus Jettenia sp. CY-1]|nr:Mut7-C RNAse domain-containing protein [Candidatus Jettenia sp.]WKZ17593.1 MAG: Mut7-C RNAse domain-containing protein [Candidatus Jettenia sp. CY-1]